MEAFITQVYETYRLPILHYLKSRGAKEESAKDIASVSIISLWKYLEKEGYQAERQEEYIKLLFTIAFRKFVDGTRSGDFKNLRLEPSDLEGSHWVQPDNYERLTVNQAQRTLKAIFLKWHEKKGEMLYNHFLLNADYECLAEDYGYSSVNSVRVTLSNCRKDFLNWLSEQPGLDEIFRYAIALVSKG